MNKHSLKYFCTSGIGEELSTFSPELRREYLRYKTFRIWDQTIPFSSPEANENTSLPDDSVGDGKLRLHNVSVPTIVYCPVESAHPAPAVLVCPGGAYKYTSFEAEGYRICSFFNSIGFSAFLLNYRCPDQRSAASADAARAIRFIRCFSSDFHIDPAALGIIGFSAGAHLAATVSAPAQQPYPADSNIDEADFTPNYTALIYPAYLTVDNETPAPEFNVSAKTPPTFLVQTQDDGIKVENALVWYKALCAAGVKTEMHLFECGGHGYGIADRPGIPVTGWQHLLEKWLKIRLDESAIPGFSREVRS